ncbi:glycosyl hydrolase family 18 protein [Anaerolineales bacterium]
MLLRLFLCISLFILITPVLAEDENPGGFCVSLWFSDEQAGALESVLKHADDIHIISPFWYKTTDSTDIGVMGDPDKTELVNLLRQEDWLILPAIFANGFNFLESEASIDAHVQSILNLVLEMDFDGIDIDYEAFPAFTRDPFSSFIQKLAEALHQENRLLSLTVHAKTTEPGIWEGARAQNWEVLALYPDFFRVMTYDYTNRNETPGPIAPTSWMLEVVTLAEQYIDLEKFYLGVPIYGYTWKRGKPPATTVSWESTYQWIDSFQPEILRDPDDMELHIDFKVPGLPSQQVYLVDAPAVESKLGTVLEQFPNVGGIAIWGLGGEDPSIWEYIQSLQASQACHALP